MQSLLRLFAVLFALVGGSMLAAPLTEIVFNFSGPPANPISELVAGPDGALYGTTSAGGGSGKGTVFKIGLTGQPQTVLEFSGNGAKNKGTAPAGALLLASDGNFYGTTSRGGASDLGTVFKMTPQGVLTTLAELTGAGDFNRGARPFAGLVDGIDGFLYGTTSKGGFSNLGTILRVSLADQTVDTVLEFTGTAQGAKGSIPLSPLTLGSDGKLYGVTSQGGAVNSGTVFSLASDGTFKTLVNFAGAVGNTKGSAPFGALVEGNDGNFYGTTARGGAGDFGTVFRMTATGALTTLVEFTGSTGAKKGAQPEAALIADAAGDFYGTTYAGGAGNVGTVFKVTPAGKLTTLAELTGKAGARRGTFPLAGLLLASNGDFYGTTFRGGTGDAGTVFRITAAGALTTLAELPAVNVATFAEPGVTLGSNGSIYGVSTTNGITGKGSIFRISFTGDFTTIAELTGQGTINRGEAPHAPLVEGAGNFYGTTERGGAADLGTLFKVAPGGALTTLAEFTGTDGTKKGATPRAALTADGLGNFFGTTAAGGSANLGTIFELKSDNTLITLVEFSGNGAAQKGADPEATLLLAPDGKFYGTTVRGGAKDLGTVFSMTPGGVLTTLIEFTDGVAGAKGAYPQAGLIRGDDGNFYGTTSSGGATGDGSIFRLTPAGVLTTLIEFTDHRATNKGSFPEAPLIQVSDGNFYGTTKFGGTLGQGTAFKLTPAGVLTTLAELHYGDAVNAGAYPAAPFFLGSDGNIYTTTTSGGTLGAGTVFRIRLRAATLKEEVVSLLPDAARVRAQVRGGTLGGMVAFDYGLDMQYASRTTFQPLGNSTADLIVTADLTGLQPNTTYHYRTVVTDSSGTVFGPDAMFTTEPLSTQVLASGRPVSGEPADTLIASFGIPSIAHNGAVAVLANLTTAKGPDSALLVGQPPVVVVRKSTPAPKADATTATFTSFSDPVCSGAGRIAFAAKILSGATAGSGLWTNTAGPLQLVASVGGVVAGVAGHFTAITSYAMGADGTVFYTGIYSTGSLQIPGVWAFDTAGNHLLLRSGDTVGDLKVATIAALTPVAGSPGQGRGYRDDVVVARVSFTNLTQGIVELSPKAAPVAVATTPLRFSIHPPFTFAQTLGVPSLAPGGFNAFKGATSGGTQLIIANSPTSDLSLVARGGNDAPGIDQASFAKFADPVFNGQLVTAFAATVSGSGVTLKNQTGLWQTTADSSLALVARAGTEPPGVPGGLFDSFTSLALPDNAGPVFVAKVAAGPLQAGLPSGINVNNNVGLWGLDSTGTLRLLVRNGDPLHVAGASKTLSLFTILGAVPGSSGQARSYNDTGDLVYRATFTDHSQAIMRLHLP